MPIVERTAVRIGPGERRALARLADRLRRADPYLRSADALPAGTYTGVEPALPSFVIHDLEPVLAPGERRWTQSEYRALFQAGPGDAVALWTRRVPAFEAYTRDVLRLGDPTILRPSGPHDPTSSLTVRCLRDATIVDAIAARVRDRGGLTVHPYVGTESVWSLAGEIARRGGAAVAVAAPPPRVTRRANHKLWFAERVAEVLGRRRLPRTTSADGPAVLAERVGALAREHDSIALKIPNASAGLGNLVVDGRRVRELSARELHEALAGLLRRRGWRRSFPLLVSVWESPVPVSPSVQLWVPRPAAGTPIVEGIFEQRVVGTMGHFVGAAPAPLPPAQHGRLAREATLIATLLQELGYFGRCSLDAVLVGGNVEDAEIRWIECNGRWGGTSIPMTAMNRLAGDATGLSFVASYDGPVLDFAEALERTHGRLFRPGRRRGVVYLGPGDVEADRGVDILTIGRTREEAEREIWVVRALLED